MFHFTTHCIDRENKYFNLLGFKLSAMIISDYKATIGILLHIIRAPIKINCTHPHGSDSVFDG